MLKILGVLQKMILAVGWGPHIWVQIVFGWAVEEENVDFKGIPEKPVPPNSSNLKSKRTSFILFSAISRRLLSKPFNCSETYIANVSAINIGEGLVLSKTSMHLVINFCFSSFGLPRLLLQDFSLEGTLESKIKGPSCRSLSLSLSLSTLIESGSFHVDVLLAVFFICSTNLILTINGQELS